MGRFEYWVDVAASKQTSKVLKEAEKSQCGKELKSIYLVNTTGLTLLIRERSKKEDRRSELEEKQVLEKQLLEEMNEKEKARKRTRGPYRKASQI